MVDQRLGLTIVFNGCIYNHESLRNTLLGRGHTFSSHSDTEVIVKAYAEWGTECVRRFRGMFAFAIVEHDSGRVVLARDRLGVKPLYLDHSAARLRFASTLPALLAAGGVDTSIDKVALSHYLSFHSVVAPPRTILTGVRKLPPATVRVIEPDGSIRDTLYWEPSFIRSPEHAGWSERDWHDAVLELLRSAVSRRMVADVPVGVLLSGGLDSSLLVALLAESGHRSLATFSIGFDSAGGDAGDEFEFSDAVVRRFATDHHRIRIDADRLLQAVDGTVSSMSEPIMSSGAFGFYLLGQDVAGSHKVVQCGQGADEVWAGYHWHAALADVSRDRAVDGYAAAFMDRPLHELSAMLDPEWMLDEDEPRSFLASHFARPGAATAVDAALRHDTQITLVDEPLARVDAMLMASGVEARVPYLDHELVELGAAVPPELKLAHGGKGVLKLAARGLVPDDVIDRAKGYFPVPPIEQLAGPFLDLVRAALTDPAAKRRGLFRTSTVETLLADPNGTRTRIGSNALWQMGLLEMWLQAMGVD